MEAASSPCGFPGPCAADREDSGGLLEQGPIDVCGLGSQSRIVTGTVPCVLNSDLRGDNCTAVGSAPGASWNLTPTLTRTLTLTLSLNLTLSLTLTLYQTGTLAKFLTSALHEIHEIGVTLPW